MAGTSCELVIADARERNDAFWLLFDWNEPNPIQSIMNPISTTFLLIPLLIPYHDQ